MYSNTPENQAKMLKHTVSDMHSALGSLQQLTIRLNAVAQQVAGMQHQVRYTLDTLLEANGLNKQIPEVAERALRSSINEKVRELIQHEFIDWLQNNYIMDEHDTKTGVASKTLYEAYMVARGQHISQKTLAASLQHAGYPITTIGAMRYDERGRGSKTSYRGVRGLAPRDIRTMEALASAYHKEKERLQPWDMVQKDYYRKARQIVLNDSIAGMVKSMDDDGNMIEVPAYKDNVKIDE